MTLYLFDDRSVYEADLDAESDGIMPDLSLFNGVKVWDRVVAGKEGARWQWSDLFNLTDATWRWCGKTPELAMYIRQLRRALLLPLESQLREGLADCLLLAEEEGRRRLVVRGRHRYGPSNWERADILAEVEAICGPGRKAGRQYLFVCPFHSDRHPSLSVDPVKKVWICRVEGRGGGIVAWRKAVAA